MNALAVGTAIGLGLVLFTAGWVIGDELEERRPAEPDPRGLPVTCEPDRERCWQQGRPVEVPDPYARCREGRGPLTGNWQWLIAGEDQQSPFYWTYACVDLGE